MSPTADDVAAGACIGADRPSREAPVVVANGPGRSALDYRVGTQATFKAMLLDRLSSPDVAALNGLTTREDDDVTVAVLDAAAVVADVVTFYQERIANESYLRTATERRSLVELAGLIGYRPRPGVAATAHLAFEVDEAAPPEGAPIPAGTRVQSLPGPGQLPQSFETVEPVVGRPEWNAMRPVARRPHPALTASTATVTVRGTALGLQPGDPLLAVTGPGTADRVVKEVMAIEEDLVAGTTRLALAEDPPDPAPLTFVVLPLAVWSHVPVPLTATAVGTQVLGTRWRMADLRAYTLVQRWSTAKLRVHVATQLVAARVQAPPEQGVFLFRQAASVFGHNAPLYSSVPTPPAGATKPPNWEGRTLGAEPGAAIGGVDLDMRYTGVSTGSWVVLDSPTRRTVCRVVGTSELSRADYTLSSKVTRVRVDQQSQLANHTVRETTVRIQSQRLDLAELPVGDVVAGDRLVLEGVYVDLAEGRPVVVGGRRTDLDGVDDREVVTLAEVTSNGGNTELRFVTALVHSYERASVTVNANVAVATHGERRDQVLGHGDSTVPFPRYPLAEAPLTYVPAATAAGAASTLEVRVNELRWQEVDNLLGSGPDDQVFVTRTDDDGRTTVQFGDGRTGARPPTGQANVQVTYRKGMGPEGLVGEDQLSLLLTRPQGVRSVTNPVAAEGGAGPESIEDVRRNATLVTGALDRIVSLVDYEDFARAFSGIGEALATWDRDGQGGGVFLTVAGPDGAAVTEGGVLHRNLLTAMLAASVPGVPLVVRTYRPAFFRVAAGLVLDPARDADAVLVAAEAALRAAFAFAARRFGQPVMRSEVIAVLHTVPGVQAVDLDAFGRVDDPAGGLAEVLPAELPRAGVATVAGAPTAARVTLPAEQLLLDPRPVALTVVPS